MLMCTGCALWQVSQVGIYGSMSLSTDRYLSRLVHEHGQGGLARLQQRYVADPFTTIRVALPSCRVH